MASDSTPEFPLHIVMYPWYAMGHLTPFLHLSNRLAESGHRISFIMPTKTIQKFISLNHYPNLITFIPIALPFVEGLQREAETTLDVPFTSRHLIMTAMDLSKPIIAEYLQNLKPDFVFYDLSHWLPELAQGLNLHIKCVFYCTSSAANVDFNTRLEKKFLERNLSIQDLVDPPTSFGPFMYKIPTYRAKILVERATTEFWNGMTYKERLSVSWRQSHAIAFKSCREIEGPYLDRIQNYYQKPILVVGPVIPTPPTTILDEKWGDWLNQFKPKSVIFCAFGSECALQNDKLEELLLGFEKTGLPFLAALKPPMGYDTIESALPKGFKNRVKERGAVHGGWVQQQLILKHPSVGCFVTHCACGSAGSISEGLVSECQLIFLPNIADQHTNAKVMGKVLKVGVEVERRDDDGFFGRDDVFKAVTVVMDKNSEIGKEVAKNHANWRQVLLKECFERCYIDSFIEDLKSLLK